MSAPRLRTSRGQIEGVDRLGATLGSFRRDASILGSAMLVSTLIGIGQTLVLPKLLAIDVFGRFRAYSVYAGYVGLLHFGLADGALLFWAGRATATVRAEWRVVRKWLAIQQAAILLIGVLAGFLIGGEGGRLVIWVAVTALVTNVLTLAQYALQATRQMRRAGLTTLVGPIAFLSAVILLPSTWRQTSTIIGTYVVTQSLATLAGWVWISRGLDAEDPWEGRLSLNLLFRLGAPVVLANAAAGVAISFDRLFLSVVLPPARFAIYAFASSFMFLPSTGALALGRAALPHASGITSVEREQFFSRLLRLLVLVFGVALIGFPMSGVLLRSWLPKYAEAIPILKALTCGALFWTATQVVTVTALQVSGQVQWVFFTSVISAAMTAAACGVAFVLHLPLWGFAAAAATGMAAGWFVAFLITSRLLWDGRLGAGAQFISLAVFLTGASVFAEQVSSVAWEATLLYCCLSSIPLIHLAVRLRGTRGLSWLTLSAPRR